MILLFAFTEKRKVTYKAPERGFNIEGLPIKQLINHNEEQMIVGILSEADTRRIINGVVQTYIDGMEGRIRKIVHHVFRQIGFSRAPNLVVRAIMSDIANYDTSLLLTRNTRASSTNQFFVGSADYLTAFGYNIVPR